VAEDSDEESLLSETELEESLTKLTPEAGATDAHPLLLQEVTHGGSDGSALLWREVGAEPLTHGLSSGGILIEDELVSSASGHQGVSLAAAFGESLDHGLGRVALGQMGALLRDDIT
jgi:hypothetical protein